MLCCSVICAAHIRSSTGVETLDADSAQGTDAALRQRAFTRCQFWALVALFLWPSAALGSPSKEQSARSDNTQRASASGDASASPSPSKADPPNVKKARGATEEAERDDDIDIEEVVVTGTRTAKRLSEATVATEVISRHEVERSGATNAAELLEEHPGVNILEVSSNPAMEDWHMGDAEQTPRAQVYIVRTRLDAYVKFLIQEHDAGVFTIDWAFSGAGKATF